MRGSFAELSSPAFAAAAGEQANDYLHITLTDEADIIDAALRLQQLYPNLMKLDYDNARTWAERQPVLAARPEEKRPLELFEEFYRAQTAQELQPEQRELLARLIEAIWEGEGGEPV